MAWLWALPLIMVAAAAWASWSARLDRRNRVRLGVTTAATYGQERLWLPGRPERVLDAAWDALLGLPNAAPERLRRSDQSVSMRTRWGAASWGQRVTVTVEEQSSGGVEVLVTSKSIIPTARVDYGVNVANTRDIAAFLTGRVGVQ